MGSTVEFHIFEIVVGADDPCLEFVKLCYRVQSQSYQSKSNGYALAQLNNSDHLYMQ